MTTNEADMDTPALEYLVGAHFHEDWREQYGSVDGVVAEFVDEAVDDARLVVAEIDQTLAAFSTDQEVEHYLDTLGSVYRAPIDLGGYRGWLLRLRDLVEKELGQAQTAGTSYGRSNPTAEDV